MRVNYFGYYLKNEQTGIKYLFDIRPFLKAFCKIESKSFKNRFDYNDEKLYLINKGSDTFLFIMTRSQELIKKIDTDKLTVEELEDMLSSSEQIGFASYLIVKEDNFGFASTVLAPKIDVFGSFISKIFTSLNLPNWQFIVEPFFSTVPKSDALELPYIGRTHIQVTAENSWFKDLKNKYAGDAEDAEEIGEFEIIIRPKSRKSINKSIGNILKSIPDEGTKRIFMRAKDESMSHMTDLYIIGKGAIFDEIPKSKENKITNALENKYVKNRKLSEKVEEFRTNEEFEKVIPDSVYRFNDYSTWTSALSALLFDEESELDTTPETV